jgi:hypothetical protein
MIIIFFQDCLRVLKWRLLLWEEGVRLSVITLSREEHWFAASWLTIFSEQNVTALCIPPSCYMPPPTLFAWNYKPFIKLGITAFLDSVHRPVFWRTQRFGNWICFRPQLRGWEISTLLCPLEKLTLITGCSKSEYYTPSSEPFRISLSVYLQVVFYNTFFFQDIFYSDLSLNLSKGSNGRPRRSSSG